MRACHRALPDCPEETALTVLAAYLVSVLGSYAELYNAQFRYGRGGRLHWGMVIGAAVALAKQGNRLAVCGMGVGLRTPVVVEVATLRKV